MEKTGLTGHSNAGQKLQTFDAPNGLVFFQHNPSETAFVYREIFEDRVYLRHGISLADGDCVFDVGANIGLFTIYCQENFKNLKSYAFEPSPEIFGVLGANVEKYGANVTAYQCGVSDKPQVKNFTYYPQYSIMSGFHADAENDTRALREGILGQLRASHPESTDIEGRHVDGIVDMALGNKVVYACSLRPLSEIIREAAVKKIDLLKVDAEGCEMEVLCGINAEDWAIVRQIAIEAHTEAVAGDAQKLLESRGFKCVIEHEPGLIGAGIINCFAVRNG